MDEEFEGFFFSFPFLLLLTLSPLLNKVDEMTENIRMKAAICSNGRKLFSLPPWLIRLMCAPMTLTIFNKRTWIEENYASGKIS